MRSWTRKARRSSNRAAPTSISSTSSPWRSTFSTSGSRLISVEPYANRETGERILAAYAFPRPFDWAVLVGKSEADAYAAINMMIESLGLWVLGGLVIAIGGAVVFALGISRPILEIDRVAGEVAKGNFRARVENVRSKDEIGDLGRRMNDMIVGLAERFHLEKFVSGGTLAAVKIADHQGVALGGEKRLATMLFCDIRGYTAFAEKRDPEVVVEVLNFTFQRQADIVSRHHGDIDKFVGDQIVAVFLGDDMVLNACLCALEIQDAMAELGREHPDWGLAVGIGINAGEVIMGAMGSSNRMDYTVLGDAVNLAARLCSHAARGQTLLSAALLCGDRRPAGARGRAAGADRGQGQERAGARLCHPSQGRGARAGQGAHGVRLVLFSLRPAILLQTT